MARSTRIYVVLDCREPENQVVAAFTVKHECVAWLARQSDFNIDALAIATFTDGHAARRISCGGAREFGA